MIYAVIMAGGVGARFWPMSRKERPKQFLKLFSQNTLIQQTSKRLEGFIKPEHVMVITNNDYTHFVRDQLPGTNQSYVIGEPVAKNTAPCIASAAAVLMVDDPEAVMVVMPADHEIKDKEALQNVFRAATETAINQESLVTIGIEPNRPETGYGYIRRESDKISDISGYPVYNVRNFTEKPELEKAREFMDSGDYLWNSGIFVWKASTIIDAFKKHLPEMYTHIETLMSSDITQEDLNKFYHSCPSVSIDYGIMEKAEKVHVIPANFDWNDIGSWQAVHELSDKDADQNATSTPDVIFHQSSGNYVHSESGKLITLIGVENLTVVETDDAIMVLNLEKAQEVKNVVNILKDTPKRSGFL